MADGMAPNTSLMVTATVADIAHVAAKMRPDEIEQWLALTGAGQYDADVMVRGIVGAGGASWALVDNTGRPFIVGGFQVERHGVASVWLVGTADGWAKHWRMITKICRRSIAALLNDFHRVEVTSLASRVHAHAWYRRVGLTHEEPLKAWFANGADAVTFAALRNKA